MPESTKPNSDEVTRDSSLVEKIAHIINDLPTFQKRGWNAGQKFNFVSVEQLGIHGQRAGRPLAGPQALDATDAAATPLKIL